MLRTAFTDTWEEIDLFWFHRLVIIDKDYFQLILRLLRGSDKSFVDDLVASGYCKHESNLCVARCWGLSLVSMICSSLFFKVSLPWFSYQGPGFVFRWFLRIGGFGFSKFFGFFFRKRNSVRKKKSRFRWKKIETSLKQKRTLKNFRRRLEKKFQRTLRKIQRTLEKELRCRSVQACVASSLVRKCFSEFQKFSKICRFFFFYNFKFFLFSKFARKKKLEVLKKRFLALISVFVLEEYGPCFVSKNGEANSGWNPGVFTVFSCWDFLTLKTFSSLVFFFFGYCSHDDCVINVMTIPI